ncbi:hypothetical protein [Paraburkholderia xenovorans]
MDAIEKQYFSKPKNHISIRHYVTSLLDSGRVIEASFFCEKMLQEAPTNKYANKLAFLLAIRRMDPFVERYDKALASSGMKNKERFILHCRYYFAFYDREKLKGSVNAAMDEGLSDSDSLGVVLECVLWLNDIRIARKFIALYLNKGAQVSPQAEVELKKILRTRLAEILSSMPGHAHD